MARSHLGVLVFLLHPFALQALRAAPLVKLGQKSVFAFVWRSLLKYIYMYIYKFILAVGELLRGSDQEVDVVTCERICWVSQCSRAREYCMNVSLSRSSIMPMHGRSKKLLLMRLRFSCLGRRLCV